MTYFKVISDDGQILFVEKTEAPIFVRFQKTHNIIIGCQQKDAEGVVIDHGESVLCVLNGKNLNGYNKTDDAPIAVVISELEYEEYTLNHKDDDIEDESPQIPADVQEETVLTRAELTKRVEELEAQNRFLQDCLLEMSEIVYQ